MGRIPIIDNTIPNLSHHDHKRAKNWVAIVHRDLTAPGGLARTFLTRAHDGRVVVPDNLADGMALEMAGDYYTGDGKKVPNRAYHRITCAEVDFIETEEIDKNDIGPAVAEKDKPEDVLVIEPAGAPSTPPATFTDFKTGEPLTTLANLFVHYSLDEVLDAIEKKLEHVKGESPDIFLSRKTEILGTIDRIRVIIDPDAPKISRTVAEPTAPTIDPTKAPHRGAWAF